MCSRVNLYYWLLFPFNVYLLHSSFPQCPIRGNHANFLLTVYQAKSSSYHFSTPLHSSDLIFLKAN